MFASLTNPTLQCFKTVLRYNISIPAMAPAAVTSIASTPPVGNVTARPASLGFEPAVELAVDVGDDAEVAEPAWAEVCELDEASVAELDDASVSVAVEAVLVAWALAGVVM